MLQDLYMNSSMTVLLERKNVTNQLRQTELFKELQKRKGCVIKKVLSSCSIVAEQHP